jgi:adenylate cyclase
MNKTLKKILLSPWTAILTLTLLVGLRVTDPTFIESVRLRYFDTLITSKAPTENNIYTVNIDEKTLDKYGQWPFKRDQYANLIAQLYSHNAGLVVWNIMMPEADRLGGDLALADTIKDRPVILANTPAQKTKNKPRQPGSAIIGADYMDMIISYPGVIANIPVLENNAAGIGTTNTLPEVDGVNRRMPLVATIDGKIYPTLALETLRVASGDSTIQVKLNENGVEKMRIPKIGPIATDSLGRVWIDWSQQSKSVSAVELPKDFGGAIVIVGTSAAGLGNPLPTSKGAVWPQDAQASLIGTLANGVNIQRPDWADGAEILTLIVLGIILLFLTRWTYVGIISGVIIIGSILPISQYLYSSNLWLLDSTILIGGLVVVMLHAYGIKFVSEFLQKQQIKKQFGTYLSPALVEKLQKNPELLRLGGESKELSIMFTDVRGFTTISEHYGADVQGLTKIMNRYMTAMTKKILDNNGTLDKYIGDAQMAFWNAPLDDEHHAKHAVKTAIEMLGDLDAFNNEIAKEGVPAFGMGLGINTGTVVVGNMGSDQRFDFTCLGDSVNLASRLEGQSKPYGVKLVLGSRTAELVKDEYSITELDCIAVKGKKEGVKIFTLAPDNELHQQWLELYYKGEWKKALILIPQLKNVTPELEHYYDNMAERLKEGVPSDWDGTYRATSK